MREERIVALREVEMSCYSVCLFILQEETNAVKAAQAALADLFRDSEFWALPEELRERRLCRVAAARSMEWRKHHSRQ